MKNLAGLKITLVALASLGGWLVLASGQNDPAKKPAGEPKEGKADAATAGLDHEDAYPEVFSPAAVEVPLPDGTRRRIHIQRQNPTKTPQAKGRYFHAPLLQFAVRERNYEGYPPIVLDIDAASANDGTIALYFRMITTTPELRLRCRDAVLRDDRVGALSDGTTEADIHVVGWPIKHAVIACKNTSTGEIIGTTQTDNLRANVDDFRFVINFGPEGLDKFRRFADTGRLEFVFTYSYRGATAYSGTVDLKGLKDTQLIASQELRSEQIEGKAPIFQAEANRVARQVFLAVNKTVRASNEKIVPLLEPSGVVQKLFADSGEINLAMAEKGDEKTAEMLAAYLKPHLEQVRESFGGERSKIKIHEDRGGESEKGHWDLQGSVGATIPIAKIPISFSLGGGGGRETTTAKEVVDRVERTTGSKWGYDKTSERFRPHAVRKFKLIAANERAEIIDKTSAFLAVGPVKGYLEDTPVPASFTTATAISPRVAEGLQKDTVKADRPPVRNDMGAYNGVPVGAMIPFFGKELPQGYRWAEGQSRFPDDTKFGHLAGKLVPDMREKLIGGAKEIKDVGEIFSSGKLNIAGHTINGNNFSTPASAAVTLKVGTEGYLLNTLGGAKADAAANAAVKPLPQLWGINTQAAGFTRGWKPIEVDCLQAAPGATALGGSQNVDAQIIKLDTADANPRHVMCRWIIRVE